MTGSNHADSIQREPFGGTVLITGGCGYLGSHLIRDLARTAGPRPLTVRILDNMQGGHYRSLMDLPPGTRYEFLEGDILDPAVVRLALRGAGAVVHLAAVVRTPMSFEHPAWVQQVNHWGTARLVESCLEAGVTRFIYASSTAVYGPGGPGDEDAPCRPVGPYAQSKLRGEESVLAASARGLRPTVLRFGTLFGNAPAMRFDAVANRFAYLAGTGRPLTVYGSGQQRRPLVHVSDAGNAIAICLERPAVTQGRILNVVGENTSIVELVRAVEAVRPAVAVRYTEQDVLTHFSFEASGAALAGLGWMPQVSLEAGMAEMLERFRYLESAALEPSALLD
jgi:UDP-glucose 4-epimerase